MKVQPRVIIWNKPQGMGIPVPEGSISLHILYDILFYFIHVYKAPGQKDTTIRDSFFMQAERSYHFDHWLHASKISSARPLILCTFFHDFIHDHSPWAGTTHKGQHFYVNMKALSLWSFVASFKQISSTSDFIHIFSWFHKCI